ncbi:MAG: nickel pincer cofactor biosynthesis protein LarC [Dialister sp.]|nr:nickel pincer cofactor biosynthesis protein LarC [Dialister sp.]
MSKKLYLDCTSGISGDMFVAAMIDLGADLEALERALQSVSDDGFHTEVRRVKKSGIDCCDFNVVLDAFHENHDHDMEYLYGHDDSHCHGEEHDHCHCHGEEHDHCHCDGEEHDNCHCHEEEHEHSHRGLAEIREIIAACDMTETAKDIAYDIFDVIAAAESAAHNLPPEEVHFHEVGALDSIVDVISAAVTFDSLGIRDVIIPKLYEGTGMVRCQHGLMPVPVPAVANIVSAFSFPLEITEAKGEYVTPTGAAIAAVLCTDHSLPKAFTITQTGMGAGKRAYTDRPGILRAMMIETEEEGGKEEIIKLETDIDDCSGEVLGYTMKKLLKAGAKDVHYTPVFMKKNRPGWELTVIAAKDDVEELEQIIFGETTTIGIREMKVERTCLPREEKEVVTPYGTASAKGVEVKGRMKWYPEYKTVKKLAKKHKVSFAEVFDAVKRAAEKRK